MNEDFAEFDPASDSDLTPAEHRPAGWWGIASVALVGLVLAVYLSAVSLIQRGVPLGCGEGSGCDEVFRSRWSGVAGLPVGVVAGGAYAAVLMCAVLIRNERNLRQHTAGWFGLLLLAAAIVSAAAWFIGLQLFVLRAFCLWCLAEHAVGLVLAVLVVLSWRQARRRSRPLRVPGQQSVPGWRAAALGVLASAILAGAQTLLVGSGPLVGRLPGGRNADTGPGPGRQVAVLNGALILDVRDLPHIGDPDDPHVIGLLFDYCCPHCRATHQFLTEGLRRYPDQYVLVLLPTPLDADCNPAVTETEPRFEEACDLARVALAVWRSNPAAYEEFDRWLFEPERPRSLDEARRRAESVVEPAALQTAFADPWVDARIAADVAAYADSGAQTIPVLLSPEMPGIVGRTESADELFAILERELGLKPTSE